MSDKVIAPTEKGSVKREGRRRNYTDEAWRRQRQSDREGWGMVYYLDPIPASFFRRQFFS
jgi:hypothetical protein